MKGVPFPLKMGYERVRLWTSEPPHQPGSRKFWVVCVAPPPLTPGGWALLQYRLMHKEELYEEGDLTDHVLQ